MKFHASNPRHRFRAYARSVPHGTSAETGARLNPKPTAIGLQTATVVGPSGQIQASGADEIHTDARVRICICICICIQHDSQTQPGSLTKHDFHLLCFVRAAMRAAQPAAPT